MKKAVSTFVLALAVSILAPAFPGHVGAAAPPKKTPAPPSILLVTIDTLRADHVGCYGDKGADTRTLDSVAAAGVRFDEARTHVPLTLPSHASILTGRLPPRTGIRGNGLFHLGAGVPTLASALRMKGYRTVAIVASSVLDRFHGLDRGFDIYDDNQRVGPKTQFNYIERGASQVVESARREIDDLGAGPFFLWVHFYDPHTPWVAPDVFADRHAGHGYDAEIAFADSAFGQLLETVRKKAGGNLVVAALSDHGESLGEHGENQHGYTLHRGVLRVPFVLSGPSVPKGIVVAEPVGLVDLAPTLAEIAGTKMDGVDGRSLSRFWKTNPPAPAPRPGTSIAGGGIWEESLHPLYDSGWAPLRGLLGADWHFVDAPRPELYDRRLDPADAKDLSRENDAVVKEHRKRLAAVAVGLGDVAEPAAPAAGGAEERERLAKLASLGYLAGAAARPHAGPRLDPKDGVAGFVAIEESSTLLLKGRTAEAKTLLEPFLKKDPTNPRIWHQMGRIRAELLDLEGADRDFRKAIALDGQSEFLRSTYAALLEKKGDLAGATKQLETVISANPRAVESVLALAGLAVRRHDTDLSEKILRKAYDAGVRDPDLNDRLGYHLLRRGSKDDAIRLFEETLALDPDDGSALLETGRAALRAGLVEQALAKFGRCARSGRGFECRMELARASIVIGKNFESAKIHLQAARQLATDDRQRKEVDERLASLAEMERNK